MKKQELISPRMEKNIGSNGRRRTPYTGGLPDTIPKRMNFISQTMIDWKWPEYAIPTYIKSHIHPEKLRF